MTENCRRFYCRTLRDNTTSLSPTEQIRNQVLCFASRLHRYAQKLGWVLVINSQEKLKLTSLYDVTNSVLNTLVFITMVFPSGLLQWFSLVGYYYRFPWRVIKMVFPGGLKQWVSLVGYYNGFPWWVITRFFPGRT